MALTSFIEPDLRIKQWSDVEPYFVDLQDSNPKTVLGIKRIIRHYSDLLSVIFENWSHASIALGANTKNKKAKARYEHLLELNPSITRAMYAFEKKLVQNSAIKDLQEYEYRQVRRALKISVDAFVEDSISLDQEIDRLSRRCEEIHSELTVPINGIEVPLLSADDGMESPDRGKREEIWRLVNGKYLETKDQMDALFGSMVYLRHRTGRRAGHPNYRSYEHYGSYPQHSIRQAEHFHKVIEDIVVPLADEISDRHRRRLRLRIARPWDTDAAKWGFEGTPKGEEPLHPFRDTDELLSKTMAVLDDIHPQFAANMEIMRQEDLLDLPTRKGKVPCAYCTNLEVQGLPFISTNASGTQSDVVTLLHESGHAMHTFLTKKYPLIFHRDTWANMTMLETVSESMEFLSLPHLHHFYPDSEDRRRAERGQLEEAVRFFPWCAIIDKFQHWIYKNPTHTATERDTYFGHLMDRFYPKSINWNGLERYRKNYWQKQSHIFSDPFYYIEYGFALLAALQMYRNSLKDPKGTVQAYIRGLRLGATKTYPRVWETMGVKYVPPGSPRFPAFVQDIMKFAMERLDQLKD